MSLPFPPPLKLSPYGLELWQAAVACVQGAKSDLDDDTAETHYQNMDRFKSLCRPLKIMDLLRRMAPNVAPELENRGARLECLLLQLLDEVGAQNCTFSNDLILGLSSVLYPNQPLGVAADRAAFTKK